MVARGWWPDGYIIVASVWMVVIYGGWINGDIMVAGGWWMDGYGIVASVWMVEIYGGCINGDIMVAGGWLDGDLWWLVSALMATSWWLDVL